MTLKELSMIRRQQVKDYLASGQTAAAWCLENNLSITTLRYWVTKCNREAKADPTQETFIELKQTSTNEVPIIVKIGAVSIELYSGFQVETLRDVITAIRSL
jgi:transposase-like protein